MNGLRAILPVYEVTLIVLTAWLIYGLGYGRGALRAYRRGRARQRAAIERARRASDVLLDGLTAMQRDHLQMIREHHVEQLARLVKEHEAEMDQAIIAAVAEAMTSRAPHPRLRAS